MFSFGPVVGPTDPGPPGPGGQGPFTFAASGTDARSGLRLSHRGSYTLAINTSPVLDPIGDKVASEGVLLSFTAAASDVDIPADTLTFSLGAGAPVGAAIDGASGAFTWTPGTSQGGSAYTLTITVSDGAGGSASRTFQVAVLEPEVISVGIYHTCGLTSGGDGTADGSVDCWGTPPGSYYGQGQAVDQPADPAHPFTQVSAGMFHTCGLKSDGSVHC